MSRLLKILAFLTIGSVVAFFPLRWLIERSSPPPDNLGMVDGRFAPCPDSPNCVSTQATTELHGIEPIAYDGDTSTAYAKILAILEADDSITVISQTSTYIHAEARSGLWKFIDDVEFQFNDAESIIQFRSASRLGYSDLDANRQRMENIRNAFMASP
ncbi:DUF1499 domain-containing protein [Candidatus Leptofilum sp.]|uniref:DUF1499 domain-containing protein n=1 Tax=Candidatus Leptofilum sp. TaxID=3241576 RepID=UPI003B5A2B10